MGSKDDKVYIKNALLEIETIEEFTRNLSYRQFMNDKKTIYATMFGLQQLVEHIKNLSTDFKKQHREIPWTDIIGFRNRIVHEYGSTDYTTVYDTITIDIFQLKELFESNLS